MKTRLGIGLLLPSFLLLVAACGGSVAPIPDGSGSGTGTGTGTGGPGAGTAPPVVAPPGSGKSTGAPAPAEGPWGVWRLVSLDGPPGEPVSDAPPAMQLELRSDGTAWRARCTDTQQDRCPSQFTYDCIGGTVAWDGAEWRVDLPGIRVGGVPEQGQIANEPGGGILVRYIYPTYSAGHFVKVDDGTGTCAP